MSSPNMPRRPYQTVLGGKVNKITKAFGANPPQGPLAFEALEKLMAGCDRVNNEIALLEDMAKKFMASQNNADHQLSAMTLLKDCIRMRKEIIESAILLSDKFGVEAPKAKVISDGPDLGGPDLDEPEQGKSEPGNTKASNGVSP